MENETEAEAEAQGIVLHALLVACARRMPGLSDELVGLIEKLRSSHEDRMSSAALLMYREPLEEWKVEIFNLPASR